MAGAIFIGDELTAAGFRLIGCDTTTPALAETAQVLAAAVECHAVVLLGATHAGAVPPGMIDAVRRRPQPLLAIIPDITGRSDVPDLAGRIRALLGVAP